MDRPVLQKRELLEELRKRGFKLPPVDASISRRKEFSPCPLSFAQQRLWFLHQLDPNSSVYHVPAAFVLKGELEMDALRQSLNQVVERHEALRTSFGIRDGAPCQQISAAATLRLEVEDLSGLGESAARAAAEARARVEAERPFDLSAGPLLRARLLRVGAREQVLLLCLHHIICDGWSMEILFAELERFYNRARLGVVEAEPELEIQYADYALWQRERLQGAELAEQLDYWREQLSGALGVLELPTDRVRPAVQSYRGGVERWSLSGGLRAGLQQLGQREGATLFMVLLAAFQTLLWRYTGQGQVVVGTPVANRPQVAVEGLIGFFVNTLALRSRVAGEESFVGLLGQVKETCVGAYGHQELPFEKLVEELQPERSLAHSPLFQVMLTMRSDQRRPLKLDGLEATPLSIEQTTAKFDWLLYAFVADDGLQLALEYNADLFEPATARRVLSCYETLLQGVISNPAQRCIDLPLLNHIDRKQLLVTWNDTRTEFPLHQSLPEMIEAQVKRTPDSPALRFEDEELTYTQLNARSNRLAHYLKEHGVGPEIRVGVLLDRSVDMVVSLLAVLKAGGAYVPLDPQYPTERLLTMISDADLKLILTQPETSERLEASLVASFCQERDRELLNRYSDENPGSVINPENAAYVIYTSGSTGRPKGAINTHSGVCNRLLWMQQFYQLDGEDRILQKTPFSFDVSVWEFFWPLISGACLVVAKPGGHQDPEYLINLIAAEKITTVHFVPSMLTMFLEEMGVERCTSLKRVICSGEALSYETQERFFERLDAELYNLYGPTEAAIDVTFWKCEANSARRTVPIGRPIANTRLYVLDARLQPVPVGVAGELYLGGAGLARGYVGQPAMTAERFVPDPHSESGGGRLYRTGDLVRYLSNGELEFLGRLDSQVKLRGYRIELGEIEAVLREHPDVREALVELRREAGGEPRLVGYVVMGHSSHDGQVRVLRRYLSERLPEYMVPGAFVQLAALPLTPNGKVDRRALPDPDPQGAGQESYVAPRSELEQKLALIWQEVLGVERVGLHNNFFDLGGHSLLLVQAHSKLRERLGLKVSVLELFKYPTISLLATHLSPDQGTTDGAGELAPDARLAQVQDRTLTRRDAALPAREVAIIGMAGRFPQAPTIDAFWQNLRNGVESIQEFSEDEVRAAGIGENLLRNDHYVRAGSILDKVEFFDAEFFGLAPREAEILDPQQRLFLECAWETIENAGYDPYRYHRPIGVFAGLSMNTYLPRLFANPTLISALNAMQTQLGNDKDFVSTRVSYKLGLTGPSLTVQTACSTSLVAVHLACQSLFLGECSMALAGGVSVRFPQKAGYLFQEGGIRSPDGHCRAFDARAAGTVGGSGVGVVLLKPLAQALADRDPIYAVIKGSAINNDGSLKVGYTAPSVTGQAAVIAEAQLMAGVTPRTISYVEAHGTGTPLGDPIEVAALTQAFGKRNGQGHYCALGSVKSNIGHLDAGAGVAGLIKTVLALQNEELPPSLHYEQPNPEIDLEESPFYVNAELRPWQRESGRPRRAGVSSFGIGGTNAHVIVEEAPPLIVDQTAEQETGAAGWNLVVLSARDGQSLSAAEDQLAQHLERHSEQDLADVAHTLQVGRHAFSQRAAVVCRTVNEAITELRNRNSPKLTSLRVQGAELENKGVVFLFPGQGAQQVNMGRGLFEAGGEFRRVVQQCSDAVRPILRSDLISVLYPEPGAEELAGQQLGETLVTQVALFAVEYALTEQLRAWGIRPSALLGHSLGQYVAACVSGTFALEDAVRLVAERGRLMQQLAPGAMLAVSLDEAALLEEIAAVSGVPAPQLWITALNGPRRTVAGGAVEAIEELERYLNHKQVQTQRLPTSRAFHTGLVDPVLKDYRELVAKTPRHSHLNPRYISNITGKWAIPVEVQSAEYWVEHMRAPVRFSDGVREIAAEGSWLWLEVGPGRALSRMVAQELKSSARSDELDHQDAPGPQHNRHEIVTTLGDSGADELSRVLKSVAQLWTDGVDVNWNALRSWSGQAAGAQLPQPRRVWLPTYPFQRKRFWLEPKKPDGIDGPGLLPEKKRHVTDWFYIPSWKQSMPPKACDVADLSRQPMCWLIFIDQSGVGSHMATRLMKHGQYVVTVVAGAEFRTASKDVYVINPRERGDYDRLLSELRSHHRAPLKIVHLWPVTQDGELAPGVGLLENHLSTGFFSLFYLAQALSACLPEEEIQINVVSNDLQKVTGEEKVRPEKATLLGPCRVVSQELPKLRCRSIDIHLTPGQTPSDELIDQLLAEFAHETDERVVAYRRDQRWIQSFEPVDLKPDAPVFKPDGVYLITGGLGGLGLTMAERLSMTAGAKLVLTGRSNFPHQDSWSEWLGSHDEHDPISVKIRRLQAIKQAGSEILLCEADVADEKQMRGVVASANQRFGKITGVIHTAGVAGGGMIQRRTPQMMEQVLAPKTRGTLVLDRLFRDQPLDFMVLCSSTASMLGGVGAVDYCAANSFLDAYAQYRGKDSKVFSINWDKWVDTGMAARIKSRESADVQRVPDNHQETGHPLIGACTVSSGADHTFETTMSAQTHWILDEHRIRGSAVAPGTAFLEMARAALAHCTADDRPIEIREMTFISPLTVGDEEARRVRIKLNQNGDVFAFAIASKALPGNGRGATWLQHAAGTMNYAADAARRSLDLQAIKERCVEKQLDLLRTTGQRKYGPRWQTLKQVYFGENEGLAVLKLPEEYAGELEVLKLHPALLDFATSFMATQYLSGAAFVPFNYHKLSIKAPLTSELYSYVKLKPNDDAERKLLNFELSITDKDGNEVVAVEQFTMKRVLDQGAQFGSASAAKQSREGYEEVATEAGADYGMQWFEGIEALERILSSCTLPQVIVSTRDFSGLARHYQKVRALPSLKATDEASAISSAYPRPDLATKYEAPRNEMEETIADLWQRVLGIENVGIFDDFFELGGDSLVALQLMSRLRESLDIEPPLARFFESPTISSLSLLMVQQLAETTDQRALSEILLELEQDSSQATA